MKSIFRIFARTSKGNDSYLYNQLLSFGLTPQYENILHAFYFSATLNQLFKLSFQSFTVQNMYLQIGRKYPIYSSRGEGEKSLQQFFNKNNANLRNYIPMERGIIQNMTLKILIRQSSMNLPSESAMVSIFENYIKKQTIIKQYRLMVANQEPNRLQNYYDIKQIVQKKWQNEDAFKQQKRLLLSETGKQKNKLIGQNHDQQQKDLPLSQEELKDVAQSESQDDKYQPHLVLYIRRNQMRLLLKINKQSMHKFGWKKNVGWAPIRQTLTASILYRTGLLDEFKKNGLKLWDPFCGSSTIPLVALSIYKSLKVRKNYQTNFVWSKWPIYKQNYLTDFMKDVDKQHENQSIQLLATDININAVRNSLNNFKQFIKQNNRIQPVQQLVNNFLKIGPSDQIFQACKNAIYVGCGDFQQFIDKFEKKLDEGGPKINIVTNLPYVGERSKQHHSIKQLNSIYRRFSEMVQKNKQRINNVFVIVDSDTKNKNHFLQISSTGWTILQRFENGGIQICLVGWQGNKVGWRQLQVYQQSPNKQAIEYDEAKKQNLQQYRSKIKEINITKYQLPKYLEKYREMRGARRVKQKIKARHLRAAYQLFSERKNKLQVYNNYARKNLALGLSRRGKTWRRKNISMIGKNIIGKQQIIKKQFQARIEEAVKKSQQAKERTKQKKQKQVKRKW